MTKKNVTVVVLCLLGFCGQTFIYPNEGIQESKMTQTFSNLFALIRDRNYFEARARFDREQALLSETETLVMNACLDNAFNRLESSDACLYTLEQESKVGISTGKHSVLPRHVQLELSRIACDNAVKQYRYRDAHQNTEKLLASFSALLSKEEIQDYNDSLEIWSILATTPPQVCTISESVSLSITRDKANLRTLPVTTGKVSTDFVLDTGANLSTVPQSTANQFEMKYLTGEITVLTSTGGSIRARLAVCPVLHIGSIEIRNAVFIVMKDEELTFPDIQYRIQGIIGYPIIAALGEFTITAKGKFMVPLKQREPVENNLALIDLMPVIQIEGNPYLFDTGASNTMLYKRYFDANRESIEKKGKKTAIAYGSAGGQTSLEGFRIKYSPTIHGQKRKTIPAVVISQDIKADKPLFTVWGIIGQDLIGAYKSITVNFSRMFVIFE